MPPAIALPDRNETWPAWSPDGRYLYYCSARLLPIEQFFNVRYDLMRMGYDIEHDRWGEPMVVVSAQQAGGSICQPKVSPDGRFVLFCLCRKLCKLLCALPSYGANDDAFCFCRWLLLES
jgi:hypothetical protein